MGIATSIRVAFSIVLGTVVGIGVWLVDRSQPRPEPTTASLDVAPPALDLELEPASSSVVYEAPPSQPFYAYLFVAGATWTLPCTTSVGFGGRTRDAVQRCRVGSVEVTARETRARIACWFVHEPEIADPDPRSTRT